MTVGSASTLPRKSARLSVPRPAKAAATGVPKATTKKVIPTKKNTVVSKASSSSKTVVPPAGPDQIAAGQPLVAQPEPAVLAVPTIPILPPAHIVPPFATTSGAASSAAVAFDLDGREATWVLYDTGTFISGRNASLYR